MLQASSDVSAASLPGVSPGLTPRKLLAVISMGLIAVPGIVFVGWFAQNQLLMRVRPGFIAMNPLSALTFMVCAVSFLCFDVSRTKSLAGSIAGAFAGIVGAVKLLEICRGVSVIDQILFRAHLVTQAVPNPMAPNTAINFLLIGAALFSLHTFGRKALIASLVAALVVLCQASLALVGYSANLPQLARLSSYTPMALHTALLFVACSAAFFFGFQESIDSIRKQFLWRVYGGFIISLGVAAVFIGLLINHQMERSYRTDAFARLRARAILIAGFGASAFQNEALFTENDKLSELGDRVSMNLALIRPDGSLIRDAKGGAGFNLGSAPDIQSARMNGTGEARTLDDVSGEPILAASAAVKSGGELLGFARASMPEDSARLPLLELRGMVIFGTGVAAIFVLPLALFFARRLTDPLVSMTAWAEAIAAGRSFPPVTLDREDEIGSLAAACGIMAEKLGRRVSDSEEARFAAEGANAAKSTFLAHVSHDIRTPLNGIQGLLALLSRAKLEPQLKRYVELAKQSAESLTAVINNVLDFSKIEAGKIELDTHAFDLRELVERTTELFGRNAISKGLELVASVQSDLPSLFVGDSERLHQVLSNLLSNAIKFTKSGDVVVKVSGERVADGRYDLLFSVTDTGVGISEEHQRKLFQAFTQADAGVSNRYGGTGLGLAICKSVVELMEGNVGIESAEGAGSRFWFSVPLYAVAESRPSIRRTLNPKSIKVLVVDDSPTLREMIAQQISTWGFPVAAAEGAAPAMQLLEKGFDTSNPFSIVIVDEEMPETGGIELAQMIRKTEKLKATVLMILLCKDELRNPQELEQLGFSGSMHKPVRQSQLFDAIVSAIHQKRSGAVASMDSAATALGARDRKARRVLLVEDNEINQIVAVEILSASGFQCDVANNGKEAIDLWAEKKHDAYDIILMDCQMPEMDGFEATRRIRKAEEAAGENGRRIPIIAITANVVKGDSERCLAAGMDAYVPKPIDPPTLLQTIDALLEGESGAVTAELRGDGSESSSALDLAKILGRTMQNRAVAHKLLTRFLEDLPPMASQLHEAILVKDQESASGLAHSLKGVCGMVSADRLSGFAAEVEQCARSGSFTDGMLACNKFQDELDRCLKEIPGLLLALKDDHTRNA